MRELVIEKVAKSGYKCGYDKWSKCKDGSSYHFVLRCLPKSQQEIYLDKQTNTHTNVHTSLYSNEYINEAMSILNLLVSETNKRWLGLK